MSRGPLWNQAKEPTVNVMDFDPATYDPTQDVEDDGEARGDGAKVELSSVEINVLIYLYLLESNLSHTAFALLSETQLSSTSLFRYFNPHYPSPSTAKGKNVANGTPGPSKSPSEGTFGKSDRRIPRGELIRKLWKAVRWEAIERHVQPNGEPYPSQCPNPFHLLIPHSCPPSFASSASNPPPITSALTLSPIPPKAPEVFPPPVEEVEEEPTAGPSRPSKSSATDESTQTEAPGKTKRKSRRLSIGSERNEESTRSASPAVLPPVQSTKKKRVRLSEGSDVDSLRTKSRLNAGKDDESGMDIDEDQPSTTTRKGKAKSTAVPNGKTSGSKSKTKIRLKFGGGSAQSPKDSSDDMDLDESEAADKVTRGPLWLDEGDISVFTDHRDMISCLSWNPRNLDVIVTGSGDGTARMWDFHSDTEPRPRALVNRGKSLVMSHKSIDAGRKSVTCMAWHPDGTFVATGSQDGVGRLFTPSGHLQGILSYGRGIINALKFSPSGSTILVAKTDFTVCLFFVGNNYNQDMKTCFDSHTKEVNDVDWLDDHVFASGGNDHTIFIFRDNDKRPRYTLKGHTDDVTRLAWSPAPRDSNGEDRLLASVSDDGNLLIWKFPAYPEDRGTNSRSISPVKPSRDGTQGREDDDYFAGSANLPGIDHCLHKLVVVEDSDNRRMDTVQWSPSCKDGRMIVAAGGRDSPVKLFDALSGQCLHVLNDFEAATGSISFSPLAQSLIAVGGWHGRLGIYNVDSGEMVKEYEIDEDPARQSARDKPMMMVMSWREDGNQLALGLYNKSLMTVNVGDLGRTPKVEK